MKIDYSQYDYAPQNTTFKEYYSHRKDNRQEVTNLSVEDKSRIIEAVLMRFLELSFVQMKHFMDNKSEIVYGADIFNTIADFVEDKFAITGGYIDGIQGSQVLSDPAPISAPHHGIQCSLSVAALRN